MCKNCTKEVEEIGIMESDLQYLPHKFVKWYCIVDGCHNNIRVIDYDNSPYFYDNVKKRENKEKRTWRGGWFNSTTHYYMCSKHKQADDYVNNIMKRLFEEENNPSTLNERFARLLMSKIVVL